MNRKARKRAEALAKRHCRICGKVGFSERTGAFLSKCCSDACAREMAGRLLHRQMLRRKRTKPERTLMRLVGGAYPDAIAERRFGVYCVDVYVPSLHLGFEADGAYWHKGREAHDAQRDRNLMDRFALPIARLGEKELMAMRFD